MKREDEHFYSGKHKKDRVVKGEPGSKRGGLNPVAGRSGPNK